MLRNLTKKITLFLTAGLITFACLSCDSSSSPKKGYEVTPEQWEKAFSRLNKESLSKEKDSANTQNSNILTRNVDDEGEYLTATKGFLFDLELMEQGAEKTAKLTYILTPDWDLLHTPDFKGIKKVISESSEEIDGGSVDTEDSISYPGIAVLYRKDGDTYCYTQPDYKYQAEAPEESDWSENTGFTYILSDGPSDSVYDLMQQVFESVKKIYDKNAFDSESGTYKFDVVQVFVEPDNSGEEVDEDAEQELSFVVVKDGVDADGNEVDGSEILNLEVKFRQEGYVDSLIVKASEQDITAYKFDIEYIESDHGGKYTFNKKKTPTLEKYLEQSSDDQGSDDQGSDDQGSSDNTGTGDGE